MLPGSEFAWGLVLGIVPEIAVGMFLWNKRLRKALRKDVREQLLADVDEGLLDPAIKRATAGVESGIQELKDLVGAEELQAQVTTVQARLEELDQALETRLEGLSVQPIQEKLEELDSSLGEHLDALYGRLDAMEQTLPARLRSSLAGADGAEKKQLYAAATEAEEHLIEEYEATLTPEEKALAKIEAWQPSPEYQAQHQLGTALIQGLKEIALGELRERRPNIVTMKRVGTGKTSKFPSVYD